MNMFTDSPTTPLDKLFPAFFSFWLKLRRRFILLLKEMEFHRVLCLGSNIHLDCRIFLQAAFTKLESLDHHAG
jgi:hypothetical protein